MSSSSHGASLGGSTLDDSAPSVGRLSAGELFVRPLQGFIRFGRWRLANWADVANVSRPQSATVPPADAKSPRGERAIPRELPAALVSAVVHALLVIVLACWSILVPTTTPPLLMIDGTFTAMAVVDEPVTANVGGSKTEPASRSPELWQLIAVDPAADASSLVRVPADAEDVEPPVATAGPVAAVRQIQHREGAAGENVLGRGIHGAEFFGVRAVGEQFVYVVDISGSMRGEKWERAREELLRSIAALGPEQQFYVILFDTQAHPMFDDRHAEKGFLPATSPHVARLREWLERQEMGHNTSPCLAMKHALDLKPAAVFLLTDGEFNDPTAGYLRENNRVLVKGKKVPAAIVHTIGLGDAAGGRLLARIAKDNGGEFRVAKVAE